MDEFETKLEDFKEAVEQIASEPDIEIVVEGDKPKSTEVDQSPTIGKKDAPTETHKTSRNERYYSKRLNEANIRAQAAAEAYQQAAQQNEWLKNQLIEKDNQVHNYYERAVNEHLNNLEGKIKEASDNGDFSLASKLTKDLSKYSADLAVNRSQKDKSDYYGSNYQQQPVSSHVFPDPVAEVNPYLEEFISENSWCDPDSHDFDQTLAEEAHQIELSLMKQLKLQKQGEKIGSAEYFNQISNVIKKKYLGSSNNESINDVEEVLKIPAKHSNVAPVSRSMTNNYNNNQSNTRTRFVITPEEKDIALKMRYEGNVSDNEKLKRYVQEREVLEARGWKKTHNL